MKETEIRPREIFDAYLKLSAADAAAMLDQKDEFIDVVCPCGEQAQNKKLFVKNGFQIRLCEKCGSIYCSPRPTKKQLTEFYMNSPSSKFWAEEFFPAVVQARREKLFRPKALEIYRMMEEKNFTPQKVCDVGAGHGLLLDEFAKLWTQAHMMAVEPGQESAKVCRDKGYEVIEAMVEESEGAGQVADLVTCFEVIEHVFDPKEFVTALCHLVRQGGYCLVTGLGGDGFDIQVLGEHSKSIFPPHHLNFLSVTGLQHLFENAGFSQVVVSTPGKLDVDIVKNMYINAHIEIPQFVKTLLERGDAAIKEFQDYLVKYKLSSHVWVLAKK